MSAIVLIHYVKTDYFRDFSTMMFGDSGMPDSFDIDNIEKTHETVVQHNDVPVSNYNSQEMVDKYIEHLFHTHQGEFMDDDIRESIRTHIEHGDVSHTSMSMGDVVEIIDENGNSDYYMIMGIGIQHLN